MNHTTVQYGCGTHLENEAVIQLLLLPGTLPVVLEIASFEASEEAHHFVHARDVASSQFPAKQGEKRGRWNFLLARQ